MQTSPSDRPQTLAEKILSRTTGQAVRAGQVVISPVDYAFSHDGNRPQPMEIFHELGATEVFDPERVAMFLDHAPNAHTPAVTEMHRRMREFASAQGITLYPAGRGISHQVIPEEGRAAPGVLIVGSDSHTCTAGALNCLATGVGSTDLAAAMMLGKIWLKVPETIRVVSNGSLMPGVSSKDLILKIVGTIGAEGANYASVEFLGDTIGGLSMAARMTMTNMAVEMGAKFGVMEADRTTLDFLEARGVTATETFVSDPGAEVASTLTFDASAIVPQIAEPPSPDRVYDIDDLAGIRIHQATIGTSTNGQLEDLRAAADVLRGNRIAPGVKVYITPASQRAMLAAGREGLLELFTEAGALIGTPGCSGCTGASGFGVPGDDEVLISSANRNFTGRVGNNRAEIYLASPATVMASAIEGVIADPRRHADRLVATGGAR